MPDNVGCGHGDLAETVREGLLALAVGAGLRVMQVDDGRERDRRLRAQGLGR